MSGTDRSVNSVQEPIEETLAYMPHDYSKDERLQLNRSTDTEEVKYLRGLKIAKRLLMQEQDPRKLTLGYYYCAKPPASLSKFREEDRYFSRSLKIKNPFIYLEDQYKPEVQSFVENENLYTYQSLACDRDYQKVLKGLLDRYNQKVFEYSADHKINRVFSYEGLAYKDLSSAELDEHNRLVFSNKEELEEIAQSVVEESTTEKSESVSEDHSLGSNVIFMPEYNAMTVINNESHKYGYEIVPFFFMKFKNKISVESAEKTKEDINKALEKEEYKVLYEHLVFPNLVKPYLKNEIIIAKATQQGTDVVKLTYDLKSNRVVSKRIVFLPLGNEVKYIETDENGIISLVSSTFESSELRFYNKQMKQIFYKKLTSPYVKSIKKENSYLVLEVALDTNQNVYKFDVQNLKFEKVTYDVSTDRHVQRKKQTYRAVKNEIYPYVSFQNKDVTPQFILLSFYGGFFSTTDKQLSTSESYLVSKGAVVVKTFLRGDRDLGLKEWHKARWDGKMDAVSDILLLTESLQKQYPELKNKIFIEGWSNGGMLALRAALEKPELFAGVISGSPNTDIVEFYRLSNHDWADEYGNFDRLLTLEKLSPYHQALRTQKKLPPIFIRTAYDDPNVNPANSFKMLAALRNNHTGGPFYLMTRPFGAGHGPRGTRENVEEFSYIYSFIFKILSQK